MTVLTRISGADVRTPDDALAVMLAVKRTYEKLVVSTTSTRDLQITDDVDGPPLVYLQAMADASVVMSRVATAAAVEFQREIDLINATIGNSSSLGRTQAGGWADPTKR